MKTKLPTSIQSVKEATDFLTELHHNNESYHPEDDAFDVIWSTCEVSDSEKHHLNRLMDDIYSLPEIWTPENQGGFDPCAILMDLILKQNPEL